MATWAHRTEDERFSTGLDDMVLGEALRELTVNLAAVDHADGEAAEEVALNRVYDRLRKTLTHQQLLRAVVNLVAGWDSWRVP